MDYLIDALIISGVFLWSEIKTNDKAGLFSINKKLRGYSGISISIITGLWSLHSRDGAA